MFIQAYRLSAPFYGSHRFLVLLALEVPSVLVCIYPSLLFFLRISAIPALLYHGPYRSLGPFSPFSLDLRLSFGSFSVREISTSYKTLTFCPSQTGGNRSGTAGLAG